MPYNGSGTWFRNYSWVNDAANGIDITASRMDGDANDMAANGFGNTLTRDGQGYATSNLPMGGYIHTGVGTASARNQYPSVGQAQDNGLLFVAAGGTSDALTAAISPVITVLADGQQFYVRAGAANVTATPTLSINGLTAYTITKLGGNALVAGDIYGAGHELIFRYVLATTGFELLNPASFVGTLPTSRGGTGLTSFTSGGAMYATSSSVLTTGTLPIASGGTAATTDAGARAALSAAVLGANGDITSLTGLTTPLSVAQGGTASTTAGAALTALGVPYASTSDARTGTSTTSILSPSTAAYLPGMPCAILVFSRISGVLAIVNSYNYVASSLARSSTGQYTMKFSSSTGAFASNHFALVTCTTSAPNPNTGSFQGLVATDGTTTNTLRILDDAGNSSDPEYCIIVVY